LKKEFVGWVPQEEIPEETLSWFDPALTLFLNRADVETDMNCPAKQIRVTVIIDELTPPPTPAVTPPNPVVIKKPAKHVQSFGATQNSRHPRRLPKLPKKGF